MNQPNVPFDLSLTGHRIQDLQKGQAPDDAAAVEQIGDAIGGAFSKGASVLSPQDGDIVTFMRAPFDLVITRISAVGQNTGPVLDQTLRGRAKVEFHKSTDRDDTPIPPFATLYSTHGAGNEAVLKAAVLADEYVWFVLSDVASGVSEVHLTVEYKPLTAF